MKRFFCVLIGLILVFPCFLKAQKAKVLWERGGEIRSYSEPARITFSPDSSEMIIYQKKMYDSPIIVRNTKTGEVKRTFKNQRIFLIESIAWSPMNYVGIMSQDSLYILNSNSGEILNAHFLPGQEELRFSPSGKYIQTNYAIFKAENHSVVEFPASSAHFLTGDSLVMNMLYDSILIQKFPSRETIASYVNPIGDSKYMWAFSAENSGQFAAIANTDTVFMFKIMTGEVVKIYTEEKQTGHSFNSLTFTPDGQKLIVQSDKMSVIEISSGEIIQQSDWNSWSPTTENIYAPSNDQVLTYSHIYASDCYPSGYDVNWMEYAVRSWNLEEGKPTEIFGDGHRKDAGFIEIIDDMQIRTTSVDSISFTWRIADGEIMRREKRDGFPSVSPRNISSSGKYSLERKGAQLFLMDKQSGDTIRELKGTHFYQAIHAACFSSNEKYILASVEDYYFPATGYPTYVVIWNIDTGEPYSGFQTGCYLSDITTTPDDSYIIGTKKNFEVIVINGEGLITSIEAAQSENFLKTSIYPNPLKEWGTISHSVSKPGLLKISVHDVFGREIMVLKNEFTEAGSYTLPFKNAGFANGMYFLKTTSGMEIRTQRFSILR